MISDTLHLYTVNVVLLAMYSFLLASHCPEFESRWTYEYENVQIRVWSWKHRVIREAFFTHRVTAGYIFQAWAATSWAKAKSFACKQIDRSRHEGSFFLLTTCVHFALRNGILSNRDSIVITSYDHRWYRAFFDSRIQYEGNTTTWSPRNIGVYRSYYSTIVSRRDHGVGKDCQILVDIQLVASFIE